jgi:hypothetical protein
MSAFFALWFSMLSRTTDEDRRISPAKLKRSVTQDLALSGTEVSYRETLTGDGRDFLPFDIYRMRAFRVGFTQSIGDAIREHHLVPMILKNTPLWL